MKSFGFSSIRRRWRLISSCWIWQYEWTADAFMPRWKAPRIRRICRPYGRTPRSQSKLVLVRTGQCTYPAQYEVRILTASNIQIDFSQNICQNACLVGQPRLAAFREGRYLCRKPKAVLCRLQLHESMYCANPSMSVLHTIFRYQFSSPLRLKWKLFEVTH